MCKKAVIVLSLACVLIAGCSKSADETTPMDTSQALREIQESYTWGELEVNNISPVTAFEESGGELKIYPYNDGDSFVVVKVVYTSINDFWNTVKKTYSKTGNYKKIGDTFVVTDKTGVTYGMVKIDDDSSYLVSSTLPSSYVESVVLDLCK